MSNLQPGDIVRLNSGSPSMTVMSVYGKIENLSVKVCWLNEQHGIETTTFYASMVTPRDIDCRPPIIPNPGETYEAASTRILNRQKFS